MSGAFQGGVFQQSFQVSAPAAATVSTGGNAWQMGFGGTGSPPPHKLKLKIKVPLELLALMKKTDAQIERERLALLELL